MVLSFEAEERKRPVLEVGARVNEKFSFGSITFEMPVRHPSQVQISGEIKQGLRFGIPSYTNGIHIP